MKFLMALAATEVNQVGDQILSSGQDCSINPSCSEPSVNSTDVLETFDLTKETNRLVINSPTDVSEEKEHCKVEEEKPISNYQLCNNNQCSTPLHVDVEGDFCDNSITEQTKEEKNNLQSNTLFNQPIEDMNQLDNKACGVTEAFYANTHEGQSNPQDEIGLYNVEDGSPGRNISKLQITEFSQGFPSHFIVPNPSSNFLFRSPGDSGPRHAWGDHVQQNEGGPRHAWVDHVQQNEGGYNSDNDVYRNRIKNKKRVSLESPSGSHEGNYSFDKGHRRVKSGDFSVSGFPINIENGPNHNQFAFNTNPHNRTFLQHSQSSGSINHPLLEHRIPLMNHSVSVDTPGVVHEHLCMQSTSFVNLQAAISSAVNQCEHLEREVEEKNRQLNAGLNVKQNPSHSDCQKLEEEISCLTKEIQDMYNECDEMGILVPGDSPNRKIQRPVSDMYPRYPSVAIGPTPITAQPPPHGGTPTRHPFNNNKYPFETVKYENVINYKRKNDTNVKEQNVETPPPIPPRLPTSENWECPKCTFKNLLVAECEMCYSPRPTTLR